jgi:hypothetical protein
LRQGLPFCRIKVVRTDRKKRSGSMSCTGIEQSVIGLVHEWRVKPIFQSDGEPLCPALTTRLTQMPNCAAPVAVAAATAARQSMIKLGMMPT